MEPRLRVRPWPSHPSAHLGPRATSGVTRAPWGSCASSQGREQPPWRQTRNRPRATSRCPPWMPAPRPDSQAAQVRACCGDCHHNKQAYGCYQQTTSPPASACRAPGAGGRRTRRLCVLILLQPRQHHWQATRSQPRPAVQDTTSSTTTALPGSSHSPLLQGATFFCNSGPPQVLLPAPVSQQMILPFHLFRGSPDTPAEPPCPLALPRPAGFPSAAPRGRGPAATSQAALTLEPGLKLQLCHFPAVCPRESGLTSLGIMVASVTGIVDQPPRWFGSVPHLSSPGTRKTRWSHREPAGPEVTPACSPDSSRSLSQQPRNAVTRLLCKATVSIWWGTGVKQTEPEKAWGDSTWRGCTGCQAPGTENHHIPRTLPGLRTPRHVKSHPRLPMAKSIPAPNLLFPPLLWGILGASRDFQF